MKRKISIIALTLVIIVSCVKSSQGLRQNDVHDLMRQFLAMHVQYHELSSEISERTLQNLIDSFDYSKYYFYKTDILEFMKHSKDFNDFIVKGDYTILHLISERYKARVMENLKVADSLLGQKYNFNIDESIIVDRDKVDWAIDKKDMTERWRKNIKLQLLNYLSVTKKIDDAKSKLRKKFKLLQKRVDELDEEKLLAQYLNAFSMSLDPHSNYLTQDENEDFSISMKLKLEGIGVRLKSEDGFVVVESIITGGAADKLPAHQKLKPGDKIVAVSQADGEPLDVIDMDLRDVVKKIRGEKGTEVRLTVMRESGESKKQLRLLVPIVREEIKLEDSAAVSEVFKIDEKSGKTIGYIKLPSFYNDKESGKSSSGDVKRMLRELRDRKVSAIVLDLRGNPGGLLDEAIDIAGFFIERGPVLQLVDGRNPPQIINDVDPSIIYDGPVTVLIDRFSASASEILAGAIKDYRRGLIIGPSGTYGKGTVQSYNELSKKKGAIKVTIRIFYQPGGTSNQLEGIKPDIQVPDISVIWDIGEEKSRFPLKWTRIESAQFARFNNLNPGIVSSLASVSASRIAADRDYKKLLEKIKKFKKQIDSKEISLKEESIIEKQREKELEKSMVKDKGKKVFDLENDIFLREAFNITRDYTKTLGK